MMIFHGLPFVFQIILMNAEFVSSGNILDLLMSKALSPNTALYENQLQHSLLMNTTA